MSKSKKLFSLVLAIMMIANIFAVSASALRDTTDKVALILKTDTTKLVAGDEVIFSVVLDLPNDPSLYADGADVKLKVSSIAVAYDSAVFTYVAGSFTPNETDYTNVFDSTKTPTTSTATANGMLKTSIAHTDYAANDGAYGYTSCTNFQLFFLAEADGGVTNNTIGVSVVEGAALFTFKLKVKDTYAAGTSTNVGILQTGFLISRGAAAIALMNEGTKIAGGLIDFSQARLKLSDSGFATFGQDCKVRPGTQADPTSYISGGVLSNLDLRLEAKFDKTAFDATYAPASAGSPCQNMDEVGFIVAKTADITSAADLTVANANGSTIKKQAVNKIQDKSTYYNMVLAISGIPAADIATEYTYVAYITNGANTIYSAPATAAAADRDYLAIPNVTSLA